MLNECNQFELQKQRTLRDLARALGMHGVLATADSGYHVALLTRGAQPEQVRVHRDGFAHVALQARVRLGAHVLNVIGAHLAPFSADARASEATALARLVDPALQNVLLGDLNAISPRDAARLAPERWVQRYRDRHLGRDGRIDTRALAVLQAAGLLDLHAMLHGEATQPTRPTRAFAQPDRPALRIDYVLASAELARRVRACAPGDDPDCEVASDHVPVIADLDA